jgi:Flp pilus assembly protein TadB
VAGVVTRRRSAAALLVAATLLVLLPGSPATAGAPKLVLSGLSTQDGLVRFALTGRDLGTANLDPATVRVQVGDTVLVSRASPATAATAGLPARAEMAVLDATSRVTASQLDAARAAIGSLAAALPPDVRLGLVQLTTSAAAVIPPTTDRASLTQALAGAGGEGNATLSDGVLAAAAALRAAGFTATAERRIFVVNDGQNFNSALTDAARASFAGDPIPVDVLAYGAVGNAQSRLQAYSTATGGQLRTAADRTAARSGAASAAAVFVPALEVTATVPAPLAATSATLTVSVAGLSTTAAVTFAGSTVVAGPAAEPSTVVLPGWFAYLFALLVFAAVVAIVLALAWPRALPNRRIKQIAHFGPARTRRRPDAGSAATAIARTALAATASVVRSGGLEERISLTLERAGMRLEPHVWVLLRAGITAGGGVALFVLAGPPGAVLGLAGGWLATMLYQRLRIDRRSSQFAEQVPDALQLIIGSLRSGFSLPQALEALVRESPDPVGAEFGRALAEHRLGVDISDALERVAERVGSEDLGWAVMAVRIQREVGGNLAEVLQTSVDTMRERGRLRGHVRALSAEGRMSAWVLISLPLALGLFMFVFRTAYMAPLITDPAGLSMLLGGGALFLLGIYWLTRVVRVEA